MKALIAPVLGVVGVVWLASEVLDTIFPNDPPKEVKKKVFISFDFDNDQSLKYFLLGQAKNKKSTFTFSNKSFNKHVTGNWKAAARKKISESDLVLFMCGEKTHTAKGVTAELEIAKELGKPCFFLKGYKDKDCTLPIGANQWFTDINDWTWENIESILKKV